MFKYPLHKRLQNLTKNRLKRTSLNHVLKEQQRKQSDILVPRPEECEMLTHNRTPLVLKAKVKFSIPGISTKSSDSETSLKTLILAELDKSYPATAYIRSSPTDQLFMLHEMEDVASTSDSQTSLPLL